MLGRSRQATLRVIVTNTGEPAFQATLSVTLRAPLGVARMPAACHAPLAPTAPRADATATPTPTPTLLLCDVANPLGHNKQVTRWPSSSWASPFSLVFERHAPLACCSQVVLDVPLDVSTLSLSLLPPDASAPFLGVLLNASSAANSRDARPEDNIMSATLPLAAVVDLDLLGRASPELGLLPQQSSTKAVRFTHTYEVSKSCLPRRGGLASLQAVVGT